MNDLYQINTEVQNKNYISSDMINISGQNYPIYCFAGDNKIRNYPKVGGIYAISGIYEGNDGKLLVGKTCNENGLGGRWLQHRTKLKNNNHCNYYIQCAVNKHGWENFVFWQLEIDIPIEKLGEREGFWSDYFQSHYSKNGWNIQEITNDGGFHLSTETREKLKQINLGHTHTEETCNKMSISRSGDKNCNWGKKGSLNPIYGIKRSEETRKKMSLAAIGKKKKPTSDDTKNKLSLTSKKRISLKFINPSGEIIIFQSLRMAFKNKIIDNYNKNYVEKILNKSINGWTLIEIIYNNI